MSGATGLSRRDTVLTWVSKVAAKIHTNMFRRTGGRLGRRFRGGDLLLLTARGRRSGKEFTTPLAYVRDGGDYIVAASNGGIDREPRWWLNLQAHPHGVIELPAGRFDVTAAEVEGPQRMVMWSRLVGTGLGYDDYQARVRRRIAVVRLTPGRPAPSP